MNLPPVSIVIAAVGSFVWGFAWASFLQFTRMGKFLAVRMTWITVVIGVAGVMIVAIFAIGFDAWWRMLLLFALASIPIIFRSLYNEWRDQTASLMKFDD